MTSELYVPLEQLEKFGAWFQAETENGHFHALNRYTLRYVYACACWGAPSAFADAVAITFHEPWFEQWRTFYSQALGVHAHARDYFGARSHMGLIAPVMRQKDAHSLFAKTETAKAPYLPRSMDAIVHNIWVTALAG